MNLPRCSLHNVYADQTYQIVVEGMWTNVISMLLAAVGAALLVRVMKALQLGTAGLVDQVTKGSGCSPCAHCKLVCSVETTQCGIKHAYVPPEHEAASQLNFKLSAVTLLRLQLRHLMPLTCIWAAVKSNMHCT